MTKKQIDELKGIAQRFFTFGETKPAPAKEAGKFEAFKIKGSEDSLEYNPSLEIGSEVMKSGGTGSTPAIDGQYELDNGVIFITKDGKIESVVNDGAKPAEEEQTEVETVSAEKFAELEAALKLVQTGFAEITTAFAAIKTHVDTLPNKAEIVQFTEHLKGVGNVIEELSKIPFETVETKRGDEDALISQTEAYSRVAEAFNVGAESE